MLGLISIALDSVRIKKNKSKKRCNIRLRFNDNSVFENNIMVNKYCIERSPIFPLTKDPNFQLNEILLLPDNLANQEKQLKNTFIGSFQTFNAYKQDSTFHKVFKLKLPTCKKIKALHLKNK